MNGGFDIFDEWGNYKGRFTPAWSTEGCMGMVFGFILLTLGFFIYLLVKLTINGFKAAIAGEWGKALLNWSIPAAISALFALFIISSFISVFASQIPASTLEALPSAIPDFEDYFNPQGASVSEWNGIPVMPQATAGQEFTDTHTYSFKVDADVKEVQDFYTSELERRGWSSLFSMPSGDNSAVQTFQKDNNVLTVTITNMNGSVVVVLTMA